MNINLLKTISTRIFGLYSQFKSIVSDLETNSTPENQEWARGLLSILATELSCESSCLTDVLFPPQTEEGDEILFEIDGVINAERNPMTEDEFWELFIKWVEENKLQFGGMIGTYREEAEDGKVMAGK